MDEADFARKLQARQNEASAAYRKPVPSIKPVGWCHSCGNDVDGNRLFCSGDCASDHERMERQR